MLCATALAMLLSGCGGADGEASGPPESIAKVAAAATADGTPGAIAPGFYVDADNGDDTNPGTFAAPWKTLARAAAVRLQPGQGLYLRCGSVWRESLELDDTQLVDGSVIAGYGDCATRKAVITGANDFSGGWVLDPNGLWSRSVPAGTPKITQLFFDGLAARVAQWPEPSEAQAARVAQTPAAASAHAAAAVGLGSRVVVTQATDAAALAGRDLAGATLQLRTQPWLIETRRVSAFERGELRLDNATAWAVAGGQGFVLQDKLWMLDAEGEFFHDLAAQRLYLKAPGWVTGAILNAAQAEGSVRDNVLTVGQRSGVVIRQLALKGARDSALRLLQAPGAQVRQIEAHDNALFGVRIQTARASPATELSDSLLTRNGLYGIDASETPGVVIVRNTVKGTGNSVHHTANTIAAIAAGPGGRIEDNTVDGAGYVGINFRAQGGSVVARNTVLGTCTRLADCAGIYSYTGRARVVEGQSSSVVGNRVQGTPHANDTSALIAGIYIDDYSDGVTVADNLVADKPVGVLVHNSSHLVVRNNRLWLTRRAGIWATMDQTDGDWMRANVFEGNQIVPVVQAQAAAGALPVFTAGHAVWFWHSIEGTQALGGVRNLFRDNRVVQLQGPLAVHAWVHGGGGADTIDDARWRQHNPGEPAPQRPARFAPLVPVLGAELVADSGLDFGLAQWGSYRAPSSASFFAQSMPQRSGCDAGCISFTAGTPGDLLASPAFVLKPGVPYAYRVTMATPAGAAVRLGAPYISRDGTPWDSMADNQGFAAYNSRSNAGSERLDFESYFVAKSAAPARANIQLESLHLNVGVDQVSVREVLGWQAAAPNEWARVVLAPASGSAAVSVGCAELGWPAGCTALALDGTPVALPLAVAAGSGDRVLLRADSPFRR